MKVSFANVTAPKDGTLVLLSAEGPVLSRAAKAVDTELEGLIEKAAKAAGFKGKKGSCLDIVAPPRLPVDRVLIVGAGDPRQLDEPATVRLGGAIAGRLGELGARKATVRPDGLKGIQGNAANFAARIAFGARLRTYRFDKYKSRTGKDSEPAPPLSRLIVQCSQASPARAAYAGQDAIIDGVHFARDLVNEPANILYPSEFAKRLKLLVKHGVTVEDFGEKDLVKLGMNALLAVSSGSRREPHVVIMSYQGGGDAQPIAFVGKGVTFDAGGISLKPAANMGDMKGDMAGAGCVAGLMLALATRNAKVNAVGLVGLVENMPDGKALKPGDVITAMSGQTIEVLNTDAEGRLVLADLLHYARERFKPQAMIDLATLTGAIIVALGKHNAGLFANDDELAKRLITAGAATGEPVWRMPLGADYDKMLDSTVADMKNIGGRHAGSVTAAQFLKRFVGDTAWAHLDVAGTGMDAPKNDINQSWGTGFGVRLLDRLVADHYEARRRRPSPSKGTP